MFFKVGVETRHALSLQKNNNILIFCQSIIVQNLIVQLIKICPLSKPIRAGYLES